MYLHSTVGGRHSLPPTARPKFVPTTSDRVPTASDQRVSCMYEPKEIALNYISSPDHGKDRFFSGKDSNAKPLKTRGNLLGHKPTTRDTVNLTLQKVSALRKSKRYSELTFADDTQATKQIVRQDSISSRLIDNIVSRGKRAAQKVGGEHSSAFKLIEKLDAALGLTPCLHFGHTQEVTCIGSGRVANAIVTGSKDGSVRVWMLDARDRGNYHLFAVISHAQRQTDRLLCCETGPPSNEDPELGQTGLIRRHSSPALSTSTSSQTAALTEVTAVAILEGESLVISGTNNGDIFYTCLWSNEIEVQHSFGGQIVRDLAVISAGIEVMVISINVCKDTGLGVELEANDLGFRVTKVLPMGAIGRWNTEHPESAVQIDDVITKINDHDMCIVVEHKTEMTFPEEAMLAKFECETTLELRRCRQGSVIVGSCAGCIAQLVQVTHRRPSRRESFFKVSEPVMLPHKLPVTQLRFIGDGQSQATTDLRPNIWRPSPYYVVTCSADGASLWRIESDVMTRAVRMTTFRIGQAEETKFIAVPMRDNSLLLSASTHVVCVWDMKSALASTLDRDKSNSQPTPVERYDEKVRFFEAGLWGKDFMCGRKHKCFVRKFKRDGADLEITGSDLRARLLGPTEARIHEIPQRSGMTAIRDVYDPATGEVLVTGCMDGRVVLSDLSESEIGECLAELRSLSHLELFLPVALKVLSFLQINSFAFGPAVPWHPTVERPAEIVGPVVKLDVVKMLGLGATCFWATTWLTVAVMAAFVIVILGDLRRRLADVLDRKLTDAHEMLQVPDYVKKEIKRLRSLEKMVDAFILVCCTFLVVPMANNVAVALSCSPDVCDRALPNMIQPEIECLRLQPTVECFTGQHWNLAVAIVAVAPLYFFLLFPYAVVQGDAHYVQRHELLSIKDWKENARRKANVLYSGAVHPNHSNAFPAICTDIASKIALPVVAKLTSDNPLVQMTTITSIGLLLLVVTDIYPPFLEDTTNVVFKGMRACNLACMASALLCCVCPGTNRTEPVLVLVLSVTLAVVWTMRKVAEESAEKPRDHVHLTTLGARAVQVDPRVSVLTAEDGRMDISCANSNTEVLSDTVVGSDAMFGVDRIEALSPRRNSVGPKLPSFHRVLNIDAMDCISDCDESSGSSLSTP